MDNRGKEMVCIVCPRGCKLTICSRGDRLLVEGNACPRGADYARQEWSHPSRVLTSTVRIQGGRIPRLPVKSSGPVPKERLMDVMREVNRVQAVCPVEEGAVLIADVLGLGVDIVATRTLSAERDVDNFLK